MKKFIIIATLVAGLVSGLSADDSHYYDYKVNTKYLKNLCIKPDNSLDYSWRNALKTAIKNYNNTFSGDTYINMIYLYNISHSCTYTVKVKAIYDPHNKKSYEGYLAVTTGRHNWLKKPKDTIFINLSNTYALAYSTEKTALLMHEISHVIGFKHKGSGEGTKIPGSKYDPNPEDSIMVGGGTDNIYSDRREWTPEFSLYDILSINYLYLKR